ncbi:MAG: hypothetical protein P9L92_11770 [Candidatus Electryonea clarkiae]|nr:hypothetical protein [Candidatus Electryonea clarkiae]MDP8285055.1 hypothetical protein [Candidatus Electryonea clarkiae]
MNNKFAPILISVYTRLGHLKRCVNSLKLNKISKDSDLYIVSDAPCKNEDIPLVDEVREYINSITGFNSVNLLANKNNLGGIKSIRDARDVVFSRYDRSIFMEDDNLVSPQFLTYMNEMLTKYETNDSIYTICGYHFRINISDNYPYDIYFSRSFSAWGYALWKSKYVDIYSDTFQMNDKSALKRFKKTMTFGYEVLRRDMESGNMIGDARIGYLLFRNNQYCVLPTKTLVTNIGHDGSGLHGHVTDDYINQKFDPAFVPSRFPPEVYEDKRIKRELKRYFAVSRYKKARRVCGKIYRSLRGWLTSKN